jgi:hypothetical protein
MGRKTGSARRNSPQQQCSCWPDQIARSAFQRNSSDRFPRLMEQTMKPIVEHTPERLIVKLGGIFPHDATCVFDKSTGRARFERRLFFWRRRPIEVALADIADFEVTESSGQTESFEPRVVLRSGRKVYLSDAGTAEVNSRGDAPSATISGARAPVGAVASCRQRLRGGLDPLHIRRFGGLGIGASFHCAGPAEKAAHQQPRARYSKGSRMIAAATATPSAPKCHRHLPFWRAHQHDTESAVSRHIGPVPQCSKGGG